MHILHLMVESATQVTDGLPSADSTARAISRCAQRLAEERGLDGFTMEDLAAEVGVSRRTLFNHVPGKIDAVLGGRPPTQPEALVIFRQGGPTGELIPDIREAGAGVIRVKSGDPEEIARLRRLLRSDPRLFQAMLERLEEITDRLVEVILEREGEGFDPLRARILARATLGIFEMALTEFVDDPSVSGVEHFRRIFDLVIDLFRPGPA